MPYTEAQRRLAGIALSIKRGETPASYSPEAAKMAKSMSLKQLVDFASGPIKSQKKEGKRKSK